ncbi:MAG: Imm42 family immunity protein [Verrucomicrobia bacterium]|nr:Imm42 family immunity protein [Verrucomicrobiota bacterium]
MTVGDPGSFAIESGITVAFDRFTLLALGYFVVHIGGLRYGEPDPEGMLLSHAFDEIQSRLAWRGRHIEPFASEPDAGRIADAHQDAYRDRIWAPDQEKERFYGHSQEEFRTLIQSSHCEWGDEVFNDVSQVQHFDMDDRVRLIAFRSIEADWHHDPATLADVWLDAGEFYRILREWRDRLEAEWRAAPKWKVSEEGELLEDLP